VNSIAELNPNRLKIIPLDLNSFSWISHCVIITRFDKNHLRSTKFHRLVLVIKRLKSCSLNSCLALESSSWVMMSSNWSYDVFIKTGTVRPSKRVSQLRTGEHSLPTKENPRR